MWPGLMAFGDYVVGADDMEDRHLSWPVTPSLDRGIGAPLLPRKRWDCQRLLEIEDLDDGNTFVPCDRGRLAYRSLNAISSRMRNPDSKLSRSLTPA